MDDIKETISKLLALSQSPYEEEAQSALLKAQELMAKHKITMADLNPGEETNVIKKAVNVTCTSMTDPWALTLAQVIAKQYCCKAFCYYAPKGKEKRVAFAGLEEDFAVCKRTYLFAYDFVKARCKKLASKNRSTGLNATAIREACTAYGCGFCLGLNQAFRTQAEQHQEWALVMVVPAIVEESIADLKKKPIYTKNQIMSGNETYKQQGYQAGLSYSPNPHLGKGNDAA